MGDGYLPARNACTYPTPLAEDNPSTLRPRNTQFQPGAGSSRYSHRRRDEMDPNDKDPFPRATFVGKAPTKQAGRMINPAWRLAGSNHPYAPFTGNPLMWQSYVYDDASTCAGGLPELPCIWAGGTLLGRQARSRVRPGDRRCSLSCEFSYTTILACMQVRRLDGAQHPSQRRSDELWHIWRRWHREHQAGRSVGGLSAAGYSVGQQTCCFRACKRP